MSRENVEIVRGLSRAFSSGDWARTIELLHPDVEMDATRVPMPELARTYRGVDEVASFWGDWLEAWGEQVYEDPELIDAGDRVVGRVKQTARGTGGGAPVESAFWMVWAVSDGKITRFEIYADRDAALASAGLAG